MMYTRFLFRWRMRARQEIRQMCRFGIIGFISWLIYFFLYTLLSRVLWTSGDRTLENFFAIFFASFFNFFAHKHWTFRHIEAGWHRAVFRYALVTFSAACMESFLFWVLHALLHWYDLRVVVFASALLALYTYSFHNFFTFSRRRTE